MQPIYETVASKYQATDKNLEVTNDIVSLNTTTTAYALGYVDSEKLPDVYKPSKLTTNGTEIIFEHSYSKGYYPCGYSGSVFVANGIFSTEYIPPVQYWYHDSSGTKPYTTYSIQDTKRRYYNNFYPEYSGFVQRNNATDYLYMKIFIFNEVDSLVTDLTIYVTGWMNIWNFLHGEYTYSSSYNGSSYSVTGTDFEDGTAYIKTSDNRYSIRLFITNYSFYEKTQTGLNFTVFNMDGTIFSQENNFFVGGNSTNGLLCSISISELDKYNPVVNNSGISGFNGKFNVEILKTIPNNMYAYDGNILCQRISSTLYFNLIFPVEQIIKTISFMCRICLTSENGGTDSYVDGVTYATHVSEDNEFLGELITGDISDDTFKAQLREWQYSENGVSVNDFDPESDIPVYPNPDNPDDPDSDTTVNPARSEGVNMNALTSRVFPSANGFITMYNVSFSQLETFGRVLWKSVADYQPAQDSSLDNFYVNLGTEVTGTFDTSAILNYIVSLRQYPFSVGTMSISQQASDTNIYIGNGKVGIPISTNPRKLTSSIGYIDCGSVYVAPVTPYNDYRDYYNTVVTLFLPYCGTVELNATEVMNTTLSCIYAIDFYTGECVAFVTVDNSFNQYLITIATGTIGVMIPITSTNSSQIQARKNIDDLATIRMIQSTLGNFANFAKQTFSGDYAQSALTALNTIGGLAGSSLELESNKMTRSGVLAPYLSGGSGACAFAQPDSVYLQIRRGTYKRPSNYPSTIGYPNTVSGRLGDFSGFTICENPKLTGLTCNDEEKFMISQALQSGVYV